MAGTGVLLPVHVPDLHPKFAQQPKTTAQLLPQSLTGGPVLLPVHRVRVNGNPRHIQTIMEDLKKRQIEVEGTLQRGKSYEE